MKLTTAALVLFCAFPRTSPAQPLPAGATSRAGVAVDTVSAATLAANARTLLDADDLKTALADAEAAVASGGGADALAARAEAKLALGYPPAEALEDYAAAAGLDPRYGEKYRGLQEQMRSETRAGRPKDKGQGGAGGISMGFVGGLAGAGLGLVAAGLLFLRRKRNPGKSASEL